MGKIDVYIGFAIKSGKILFGIDNVKLSRKRIYLLLLCRTASDNLKKEAYRFAENKNIQLFETEETIESLTHKNNCKLAAILDENLAKAAADNIRR